MLSRRPRGDGHLGKLELYVHDANSPLGAHFSGLNHPFGERLHPRFGRGRGRGCRKGIGFGVAREFTGTCMLSTDAIPL